MPNEAPLGLAVIGGLLVSQLLTLYITPVYYVCIEGARMRLGRRRLARRAQEFPALAVTKQGENAAPPEGRGVGVVFYFTYQ